MVLWLDVFCLFLLDLVWERWLECVNNAFEMYLNVMSPSSGCLKNWYRRRENISRYWDKLSNSGYTTLSLSGSDNSLLQVSCVTKSHTFIDLDLRKIHSLCLYLHWNLMYVCMPTKVIEKVSAHLYLISSVLFWPLELFTTRS